MGVEIPDPNSEKRSGKNKPDFEIRHPKRGVGFSKWDFEKAIPEIKTAYKGSIFRAKTGLYQGQKYKVGVHSQN